MAEYCPLCSAERTEQTDECTNCGAYVTRWETEPFERVRLGEEEIEEVKETTLKEYLFQPKFIGRWMGLIALLMFLLAPMAAKLLNWIFG